MRLIRQCMLFAALVSIWLWGGAYLHAGSATDISGLYYTGMNSTGGLQTGGLADANWTVTYARVAGTNYSGTSTYTGAAYVVSGSYIDSGVVRVLFFLLLLLLLIRGRTGVSLCELFHKGLLIAF